MTANEVLLLQRHGGDDWSWSTSGLITRSRLSSHCAVARGFGGSIPALALWRSTLFWNAAYKKFLMVKRGNEIRRRAACCIQLYVTVVSCDRGGVDV